MSGSTTPQEISGIEVDLTICQGRDLVAKDRSLITRKKTSSDPFVKVVFNNKEYFRTSVKDKTLSPSWNESCKIHVGFDLSNKIMKQLYNPSSDSNLSNILQFHIYDEDTMTEDDFMGMVTIPLNVSQPPSTEWYPVEKGISSNLYCKNATGELQIKYSASIRKLLQVSKGNSQIIQSNAKLHVKLSWEVEGAGIDMDTSCVSIDSRGKILMDESVYYGDLVNSNGSIRHSGDATANSNRSSGSKEIKEVITCNLTLIPHVVKAMYFILTVATPGKTFKNCESASVLVSDMTSVREVVPLCQFTPCFVGEHTAMFLMRLMRDDFGSWKMTIIEDTDHTARDFGSLIPEIKSYSRDIVPNIHVDPRERIAIMRKGSAIRIADYCDVKGTIPERVVFGLAWDVTNGTNIDLDASAICLDHSRNPVDIIFFRKLKSDDGAIIHGGDEREGDEVGDDEKMYLYLSRMNPSISQVIFTINSFSGQELDDISKASCHLFDYETNRDIARYTLTNNKELNKHTGLILASFYRGNEDGENIDNTWCLRILSVPGQGRVAKDLLPSIRSYLAQNSPPPASTVPEPEIVVNAMPDDVPIEEDTTVVPPPMIPSFGK